MKARYCQRDIDQAREGIPGLSARRGGGDLPAGGLRAGSVFGCSISPYRDLFSAQEEAFGDYSAGRYAWILDHVQRLVEPIPAKGALGLWEWDSPEGFDLLGVPHELRIVFEWEAIYENSRSRELRKLDWVLVPNHHDGDGYRTLISMPREQPSLERGVWSFRWRANCSPRGLLLGTPVARILLKPSPQNDRPGSEGDRGCL